MRDLINILIFLCLLYLACFEGSKIAFFTIVFLVIIYVINYRRIKILNELNSERLNQQWSKFIEFLNHDLKIPILAQLRGVEVLEFGKFDNLTKDEVIYQIKKSCNYSLDMISMVVDTYNIENNSNKLLYERFNMTELLTNCFEFLSKEAGEKNITFAYNLKSSDTYLEADKSEIRKVIINLLSNAINYADRGKQLTVTVSDSDNQMNISMSGREFASYLLNGCKYSTIGQDIGMYFCKKIIEIHKGKIFISCDSLNEKSVSFTIPKNKRPIYN